MHHLRHSDDAAPSFVNLTQRSESLEKYHNYILTQGSFHLSPFKLPCLVVQEPVLCHSDCAGRTGSPGPASVTGPTRPTLQETTHAVTSINFVRLTHLDFYT